MLFVVYLFWFPDSSDIWKVTPEIGELFAPVFSISKLYFPVISSLWFISTVFLSVNASFLTLTTGWLDPLLPVGNKIFANVLYPLKLTLTLTLYVFPFEKPLLYVNLK